MAAAKPPKGAPTSGAAGAETRERLIDACRACLRDDGIAGVSARAIARHGDLNQALVFYHFGSVDGLLQATATEDSQRRAALYADRLGEVTTLAQLVAVGRAIHAVESERGSTAVLAQLLAGSASSEGLRAAVLAGMEPWTSLVAAAVDRVVAGTPLAEAAPTDEVAFAIASLFLGMEMFAGLDPDHDRAASLFASLETVAGLFDALVGRRA
ncbi:MAG: TetR/AcrR family transcriptional regulator [Acidimicrobiales bacterium]|nr:TetR/AcrR family transcriptional regulator [Acidimicrobiales bacterium]